MSDGASRFQMGNIGEGAIVLQGEHLQNITVQVETPQDAAALVRQLRQLGEPAYHGPLLRRLDPIVFVNRFESLAEIAKFFADPTVGVLYLLGLPAIGKSTLVRGALELRRVDTPAVWVTCEGLGAEQLWAEINAGLRPNAQAILSDLHVRLATKIAALLGAISHPSILVLDGFEVLLDANNRLSSVDRAEVMTALVTLEHKAKVLVTTRRLPSDVGEGNAGIQILRLGGLSRQMAEALFQARARLTLEQRAALLPDEVLQKLRGHPKFIELLASAIAELPIEQVVAGLLQASDIGAFVMGQVFSQMDAAELQVLRAACVFREMFTFDALNAVHSMLDNETQTIIPPVRALVQRAVLETMTGPPIGYYLHPILREAVPREAGQEAAAHAAAAKWFLRRPVNPVDFTTWDDALYHLRRAAEVGRHEIYYNPYMEFMKDYTGSLEDAGWGRRVAAEDRVLDSLARNDWEHFIARIDLGRRLKTLGELSEAIQIFRELTEGILKLPDDLPQEEEPEWLGLSTTVVSRCLSSR